MLQDEQARKAGVTTQAMQGQATRGATKIWAVSAQKAAALRLIGSQFLTPVLQNG